MFMLLSFLVACGPNDSDSDGDDSDTDVTGEAGPEQLCKIDVACVGGIIDDPKSPCTMNVTDAAGAALYSGAIGMELRGRSSLGFPKKQYAVELRAYTELPVWPGSPWMYSADGTNPGTTWKQASFDDSRWETGYGALGYGQLYLNTIIDGEDGDRPVTSYFRHKFQVYQRENVVDVDVGLMRNDGAIIYLNGTEVVRDNLPASAGPDTLAVREASDLEELAWMDYRISPEALVQGENVLAVEVHQASADSPDMRFDLYLEAEGADAPANMLDMGKDAEWILNGQYVDRSLFRNRLGSDLFSSFGAEHRYAPEQRFCELTLNGDWQGMYTLGEKIGKDDDRINILEGATPGESFIIQLGDGLGFHANEVGYGSWQRVWPPEKAAEPKIVTFLDQWESAIKAKNDDAIWSLVDLDSAVDWVILQELMKNVDSYQLSVHLYKDVQGPAYFVPWDLDLSMGYPYTDCGATGWNYREYTTFEGAVVKTEYIEVMADSPRFKARFAQRWAELRQDQLSENTILDLIAGYDATLAPVIAKNFQKWPLKDIAFKTDFVENWLCPVESYDEEHARVIAFLHARLAWIDANIATF